MSNLLAIDPGGTTGIAMMADDHMSCGNFFTFTTDTPEQLWDYVAGHAWDVVLVEQFKAQTISKYGLYTVELVGGILAIGHLQQIEVHRRTPQHRRAWQVLAHNYLIAKGEKFVIHEEDSLAHLMAWLKWVPV